MESPETLLKNQSCCESNKLILEELPSPEEFEFGARSCSIQIPNPTVNEMKLSWDEESPLGTCQLFKELESSSGLPLCVKEIETNQESPRETTSEETSDESSVPALKFAAFYVEVTQLFWARWANPDGHGKWWSEPIRACDLSSETNSGTIYVGAIPLADYNHAQEIKNLNVHAVLSLNEEWELEPVRTYLLENVLAWTPVKAKEWEEQNIDFCNVPTPDNSPLVREDMQKAIQFCLSYLKEGKNVYIHCKAGRGRSVSVAILTLFHLLNTQNQKEELLKQVIEHVKTQ